MKIIPTHRQIVEEEIYQNEWQSERIFRQSNTLLNKKEIETVFFFLVRRIFILIQKIIHHQVQMNPIRHLHQHHRQQIRRVQ